MSYVVGCDFSSHAIDLVFIDEDDQEPPRWTRYDLVGQDAFDRTRQVGTVMPPRWSTMWDDVLAVGIEHPAGKHGTGAMLRVQGAVLSMIPPGVLVKPWPPGAWRKAVGLRGNASKDDVWSLVTCSSVGRSATGEFVWPQDACDAWCIAIATRQALEEQ